MGQAGCVITSQSPIGSSIEGLLDWVAHHPSMRLISNLERELAARPLNSASLAVFFATMRAFALPVPSAVLALALRISDDWTDFAEEATARAAYVLCAAVDEFGLHEKAKRGALTHQQLFLRTAEWFGVTREALNERKNILPEGAAMGEAVRHYYRERSLGEALGFHLASEVTSLAESVAFLTGFSAQAAAYGLDTHDQCFEFFRIHVHAEPGHSSAAEELIEQYEQGRPEILAAVTAGATGYMQTYGGLIQGLRNLVKGVTT